MGVNRERDPDRVAVLARDLEHVRGPAPVRGGGRDLAIVWALTTAAGRLMPKPHAIASCPLETGAAPNHFNQDRHLNRRAIFKQKRSVALAEWRQLAA